VTILQYTSGVAMLCVLYTVILVLVYSVSGTTEQLCASFLKGNNATMCFGENCCLSETEGSLCCIGKIYAFDGEFKDVLSSVAIMLVSYGCTPQVFLAYNDLVNPTATRLDAGVGIALYIVTGLYFVAALGGYFTYGHVVSDDLLGSYPVNLVCTIARLGIVFLVAVSFPLLFHAARDATVHIITQIYTAVTKQSLEPFSKAEKFVFYGVAVGELALVYVVSLLGISMSVLLSLNGALTYGMLSFTVPGVFYWILFKENGLTFHRLTCPLLVVLGTFVMIVNIVYW